MDLYRQLRLVRQRWWIVLVTLVVALGLTALVTVRAQPRYVASVTFFVTTPSQGVTDAYQGGLFLQQRVKSYAELLTSDRLAQAAVADNQLGLTAEEVQQRVSTSTETGTVLLRASVTDTDQTRALRVTEALSAKFVELVQKVEARPDGTAGPIKIEVVSGPRVTPTPVSPQPLRNTAIGTLIGLLAGVALAILRGMADVRLRDAAGLQRVTGSPLLGEIPIDPSARTAPLIVGDAATSARAEAVRKLRTNLRFVDVHEPARVIAVTSALQGEGKTTMSCNLAIALAEAGWRVLLVDADLRRPKVGDYLGIDSGVGLTDVLVGDVQVGDVVQRWGDKSLLVLPSGSAPPNPSELLGSKAMSDLLTALRESADIVIIDTAPLLAVTDGVVVAVQADGALLVTQQGRTSRAQVAAAARALHSVSVRLLGCVLNMARVPKAEAYQYEAYRVVAETPAPTTATGERAGAGRHAERKPVADLPDHTQELTRLPR
ncbi:MULTISPECIES: polysaccharide biosynthesis tyrosine autokinase [unclassified Micromonospora]|uniref:polysaccharide biosynthesis tyrosine autokinase n=1 Tax=unclassified Micromonospora TaxID=2617518 RepID=UPI001033B475|nr:MULTISPECIES: polysaccharide biosynthesis tyrosine autokinase [unclassified Micromonospora]QKW14885.1 polysaccharide biosynthesis tyrosine autokinase [Verrucosispora sp. NA02020]TBL33218.1 polysaccharide biosynthesis tyrosine autokinase [Verrucosispora sp. SN26_14.1]